MLLTVGDVVWRYVVTGSFLGAATTGHVRAVTVAVLPLPGLVTLVTVYPYSVSQSGIIHGLHH